MHKTDLEIANNASKKHIKDIAASLNIPEDALIVYGNDKAKINYNFLDSCKDKKDGKLILVTAISPTPAGVFFSSFSSFFVGCLNETAASLAVGSALSLSATLGLGF